MTSVAILGAGGNMGRRITRTLRQDSEYELRLIEPSEQGRERMAAEGSPDAVEEAEGLRGAEIVVFAVPDKIVKHIAADIVPKLDAGTSMLFLDPAAIAADRIPHRDDVNCYVCHPTHPPLYSLLDEKDEKARHDYWGGGLARQDVVFAVAWGDEEKSKTAEQLASDMFAPVVKSHRITVEQMALLEPALSETVANGCVDVIREGLERVIEKGVPAEAATQFLFGHLQIGIALIFERFDWRLSEGAQMALRESREALFKENWHEVFEQENVMRSLIRITGGDE